MEYAYISSSILFSLQPSLHLITDVIEKSLGEKKKVCFTVFSDVVELLTCPWDGVTDEGLDPLETISQILRSYPVERYFRVEREDGLKCW